MKYDITRTPTRGARRTLDAFSDALMAEVQQRAFEEVAVGVLCERAGYPRATFYNYWDDKYDLLNYVWTRLAAQVGLDEGTSVAHDDVLLVFFGRFSDVAECHADVIARICRANPPQGYLLGSLRVYLGGVVRGFFDRCAATGHAACLPVPCELVAEHLTNTVLLVLEWRFVRGALATREEAERCLGYLAGQLA